MKFNLDTEYTVQNKVFLWRSVNHGLAIRLNKYKYCLEKDNMHELCGLEVELEFRARNVCSVRNQHWVLPNEDPSFWIEPDGLLSYC